jgi:2'-5' RNA ligase
MASHQTPFVKTNSELAKGLTRSMEIPHWQQERRPTHFLALRIPQKSSVVAQVRGLHKITERDIIDLLPYLTPVEKLHVTLSLVTVDDEAAALPKMIDSMEKVFGSESRFNLHFCNLGVFHEGRVVFIKTFADREQYRLDSKVIECRKDLAFRQKLEVKGNPYNNFVPHVTIAKVTKKTQEKFGSNARVVPRELYDPYAYEDFGQVTLPTLELCSIKGEGTEGYYRVLHSIQLKQ